MAENLIISQSTDKVARYETLVPQMEALTSGEPDLIANLSNIAAALQLRDPNYLARAVKYLLAHPEGRLTAAWGTDSELAHDQELRTNIAYLRNLPAFKDRVHAIRLVAGRHAIFNDIHLQAATVRQALANDA